MFLLDYKKLYYKNISQYTHLRKIWQFITIWTLYLHIAQPYSISSSFRKCKKKFQWEERKGKFSWIRHVCLFYMKMKDADWMDEKATEHTQAKQDFFIYSEACGCFDLACTSTLLTTCSHSSRPFDVSQSVMFSCGNASIIANQDCRSYAPVPQDGGLLHMGKRGQDLALNQSFQTEDESRQWKLRE